MKKWHYIIGAFLLWSFLCVEVGEYSGSHANVSQMMADQHAAMQRATDALAACGGPQ